MLAGPGAGIGLDGRGSGGKEGAMKTAKCHYSYHRTWKAENWTCVDLARAVKALGVGAIDFHCGMVGPAAEAPAKIKAALEETGLELSGLSLSTNFNREDAAAVDEEVEKAVAYMRVAAEIGAPVSRIFGGHVRERNDPDKLKAAGEMIVAGLAKAAAEAEKLGLVLALENHGGFPATGEEQVEVIERIGSPSLRATVDVGNYMSVGQEGHVGTALAAGCCAYVHFKDFRKKPDESKPWGWSLEACTVGAGDVDHRKCLEALKAAGYDGFVAIEYEGGEGEAEGVPESVKFTRELLKEF